MFLYGGVFLKQPAFFLNHKLALCFELEHPLRASQTCIWLEKKGVGWALGNGIFLEPLQTK